MAKFLDNFKCFAAFTLAETLIVMGIIGVVAALTIPNLNSSTADKEKVAKVKKVYSNFVDAYGRMEAVYGPFIDTINNQDLDTKPAELAQTLGDRLTEFMKTSKNCERKSNNGCFTNKILDLDGSVDSLSGVVGDSATTTYKYILADGTAVAISALYGGIAIIFDIDGSQKGLSTFGKDLFYLVLTFEGSDLSELSPGDETDECFSSGYCTYWVLQNDNMDYLKADRTGKCPNGKVLNYTTNTSCK